MGSSKSNSREALPTTNTFNCNMMFGCQEISHLERRAFLKLTESFSLSVSVLSWCPDVQVHVYIGGHISLFQGTWFFGWLWWVLYGQGLWSWLVQSHVIFAELVSRPPSPILIQESISWFLQIEFFLVAKNGKKSLTSPEGLSSNQMGLQCPLQLSLCPSSSPYHCFDSPHHLPRLVDLLQELPRLRRPVNRRIPKTRASWGPG